MAVGGTAFKKFLSQVLCCGDNKKEGVEGLFKKCSAINYNHSSKGSNGHGHGPGCRVENSWTNE